MKKSLALAIIPIAIASAICTGCKKSEEKKEGIDPDKTYTGILLAGDCPSYAFIQVTNADIGDDWTWGTKYHNVIGIANWPDSITAKQRISFKLNTSADKNVCQIQRPCTMAVIIGEYPKKIYCSSAVSVIQ